MTEATTAYRVGRAPVHRFPHAATPCFVQWLVTAICAVASLSLGLTNVTARGVDCGSALGPRDVAGQGDTLVERVRTNIDATYCESAVDGRRRAAGLWGIGALFGAWMAIHTDDAEWPDEE